MTAEELEILSRAVEGGAFDDVLLATKHHRYFYEDRELFEARVEEMLGHPCPSEIFSPPGKERFPGWSRAVLRSLVERYERLRR